MNRSETAIALLWVDLRVRSRLVAIFEGFQSNLAEDHSAQGQIG